MKLYFGLLKISTEMWFSILRTEKNSSILPNKLCELCNRQFLTSWSFSRHMKKIHEVEVIKVGSRKKFHCDIDGCEWSGASRQGLLSHKIKYHSVKVLFFQAKTCQILSS